MIDISDATITNFIKCCQEESIDIDISNVIQLQFLAYKYLFISENCKELAIKSQINEKDKTVSIFLDSSNEVINLLKNTLLVDAIL